MVAKSAERIVQSPVKRGTVKTSTIKDAIKSVKTSHSDH